MTVVRRRGAGRIVLTFLIAVLMLVLMGELIWNFVLVPRLVIRRIALDGDLELTDAQLLGMLDLQGLTWAALNEEKIQERLESYPVVRRARVVKVFPDAIRLTILRRHPLAVALVGGPQPIPAVFDKDGYVVQIGGGGNLDLPVLSGLKFPEPALGARLPDTLLRILTDLSDLRLDDPKLFSLISEIEILPHGREGYDLKLYMSHVPIPILIDREITAESMRQAVLVLDVLAADPLGMVEEADMRGGHVVFHRREEG